MNEIVRLEVTYEPFNELRPHAVHEYFRIRVKAYLGNGKILQGDDTVTKSIIVSDFEGIFGCLLEDFKHKFKKLSEEGKLS